MLSDYVEIKNEDVKETIRLAFLKFKLSGRRSMNTFIFSQAKKYKFNDTYIEYILEELNKKINTYLEGQTVEPDYKKLDFEYNKKRVTGVVQ